MENINTNFTDVFNNFHNENLEQFEFDDIRRFYQEYFMVALLQQYNAKSTQDGNHNIYRNNYIMALFSKDFVKEEELQDGQSGFVRFLYEDDEENN